jgi:hypothetical protein
MTFLKTLLAGAVLAILSPLAALAHNGLHLHDPFARITPQSGAVYVFIQNHADTDDRLISATSPDAAMVMAMTTTKGDNGMMSMTSLPDGFVIPAAGTLVLAPGHDHLMLIGLKRTLTNGETITLTLTFAKSGPMTLTVPVNSARIGPPGDTDTQFDAETDNDGGAVTAAAPAPASVATGQMSMDPVLGTPDQQAIVALMKDRFEKPDAPLAVDPVVVMGDAAIASWAQGSMAGRALLHRTAGHWALVLCAGPDLRTADFLTQHGVADAAMLSQMFNQAEDGLGAAKVSLYSSFQGVTDMSKPASN